MPLTVTALLISSKKLFVAYMMPEKRPKTAQDAPEFAHHCPKYVWLKTTQDQDWFIDWAVWTTWLVNRGSRPLFVGSTLSRGAKRSTPVPVLI